MHAALTGSGCHLGDVKIILWVGFNEKLVEFEGRRELIKARHPEKCFTLVRVENFKEKKFPLCC